MARSRRILVVEDDRDVCDALRDSLEDAGYDVRSAFNGAEALAVLHGLHEPPGLILLDLMMPVMDGEHFLEALRHEARWVDVPVVVLTADGRGLGEPSRPGVVFALRKPVQLAELLDAVGTHMLQP